MSTHNNWSLSGRTAVVTGGTKGIGKSHCPGVFEPEMPSTILLKVENPPLRLPQGDVGQYAKGQERLTCAGRRGSLLNDWE